MRGRRAINLAAKDTGSCPVAVDVTISVDAPPAFAPLLPGVVNGSVGAFVGASTTIGGKDLELATGRAFCDGIDWKLPAG
jgi:hypothetical protein